jgi:hypothetical protein
MSGNPSSTIPSADALEISWLNDPLNYAVRCFIAFLQTIFEKAPRGAFHWSPDFASTEIVITEESPINLESVEKKPVISVIEGPIQFNSTSLDDMVRIDPKTGEEFHTDLLPGTMSLNCLSRVRQEARFIAWISARTIWNLRKLFIRETYFQELGRGISIGSVTPAGALVQGDTEGEWHVCTVTCPFFLQWSDSITPLKEDWSGAPIRLLQHISGSVGPNQETGIEARLDKVPLQRSAPRYWGTEPKPPRRRGKLIVQEQKQEEPAVKSEPLHQGFKV